MLSVSTVPIETHGVLQTSVISHATGMGVQGDSLILSPDAWEMDLDLVEPEAMSIDISDDTMPDTCVWSQESMEVYVAESPMVLADNDIEIGFAVDDFSLGVAMLNDTEAHISRHTWTQYRSLDEDLPWASDDELETSDDEDELSPIVKRACLAKFEVIGRELTRLDQCDLSPQYLAQRMNELQEELVKTGRLLQGDDDDDEPLSVLADKEMIKTSANALAPQQPVVISPVALPESCATLDLERVLQSLRQFSVRESTPAADPDGPYAPSMLRPHLPSQMSLLPSSSPAGIVLQDEVLASTSASIDNHSTELPLISFDDADSGIESRRENNSDRSGFPDLEPKSAYDLICEELCSLQDLSSSYLSAAIGSEPIDMADSPSPSLATTPDPFMNFLKPFELPPIEQDPLYQHVMYIGSKEWIQDRALQCGDMKLRQDEKETSKKPRVERSTEGELTPEISVHEQTGLFNYCDLSIDATPSIVDADVNLDDLAAFKEPVSTSGLGSRSYSQGTPEMTSTASVPREILTSSDTGFFGARVCSWCLAFPDRRTSDMQEKFTRIVSTPDFVPLGTFMSNSTPEYCFAFDISPPSTPCPLSTEFNPELAPKADTIDDEDLIPSNDLSVQPERMNISSRPRNLHRRFVEWNNVRLRIPRGPFRRRNSPSEQIAIAVDGATGPENSPWPLLDCVSDSTSTKSTELDARSAAYSLGPETSITAPAVKQTSPPLPSSQSLVTVPKIDSNTPTANDESPARILCDNFILPKMTSYSSWATPFHAAANPAAPVNVLDAALASEPSSEEMPHIPGAFEAEERDAEISEEVNTDSLSDGETIHIPGAFQLENEVIEPPYDPLGPSFLRRASLMFFGW